jgi:hypothetical protein
VNNNKEYTSVLCDMCQMDELFVKKENYTDDILYVCADCVKSTTNVQRLHAMYAKELGENGFNFLRSMSLSFFDGDKSKYNIKQYYLEYLDSLRLAVLADEIGVLDSSSVVDKPLSSVPQFENLNTVDDLFRSLEVEEE